MEAAPGGGMRIPIRQQLLEAVLGVIGLVRPLAERIGRHDRDLATQLRRALNSVGLNVSEGFGAHAGNARLRFESARGSLYETHAAIRIAGAWGYISEEQAAEALVAIDRLGS